MHGESGRASTLCFEDSRRCLRRRDVHHRNAHCAGAHCKIIKRVGTPLPSHYPASCQPARLSRARWLNVPYHQHTAVQGNPMRRAIIYFLRTVTVVIGLGALALLLWEPHIEGRNAHATLFQIYFNDPFLAYAYLASIPFFVAVYQAFKFLGYSENNAPLASERKSPPDYKILCIGYRWFRCGWRTRLHTVQQLRRQNGRRCYRRPHRSRLTCGCGHSSDV